jgi:hypothetical protein
MEVLLTALSLHVIASGAKQSRQPREGIASSQTALLAMSVVQGVMVVWCVIASEAKQSHRPARGDCFVGTNRLLAMTVGQGVIASGAKQSPHPARGDCFVGTNRLLAMT